MTIKKKNLFLTKNTASALIIGLTTYVSLTDPCFANRGKSLRDAASEIEHNAATPTKKRKLANHEARKLEVSSRFPSVCARIKEAKSEENYRQDSDYIKDLGTLKALADENLIPGPAYIFAKEIQDKDENLSKKYFEQVIGDNFPAEKNPYYAKALYKLGLLHEKKGDPKNAVLHFERAVDRDHIPSCAKFGLILVKSTDHIDTYNRGIQLLKKAKDEPGVREKLEELNVIQPVKKWSFWPF